MVTLPMMLQRQVLQFNFTRVTKTAAVTDNGGDGNTGTGDIINYTITVENKGMLH